MHDPSDKCTTTLRFKTTHLLHLNPTYIGRALIELNVSSYMMGFRKVSSFTIKVDITRRKYLPYINIKTRFDERQFIFQLERINLRDHDSKSFPCRLSKTNSIYSLISINPLMHNVPKWSDTF